jgi:hypothetical protein
MRYLIFRLRFVGLVAFALVGAMWPTAAQAATNPSLGSAAGFAVLAGTAASCTTSSVTGNVGVNFNPPTTAGCNAQYAPGAYSAFRSAFTGTKPACSTTVGSTFPNAATNLAPGAYCTGAALTFTDQTLNLTGTGSWFFEIGAGFTATNLSVVMANGGNPCNVFWWVGADATLTVNKPVSAPFQGTILGGGAITLTGSAASRTALTLTGHVWATTAFTMTDSTVIGCNAAGTVVCSNGGRDNEDEDAGQSSKTANKDGDTEKGGDKAECKPAKECNQGVASSHEECEQGDSNQGDESRSGDESGSSAENRGHKDDGETSKALAKVNKAQHTSTVAAKKTSANHTGTVLAKVSSTQHSSTVVMKQSTSKHKSGHAAKQGGKKHSNGESNSKND